MIFCFCFLAVESPGTVCSQQDPATTNDMLLSLEEGVLASFHWWSNLSGKLIHFKRGKAELGSASNSFPQLPPVLPCANLKGYSPSFKGFLSVKSGDEGISHSWRMLQCLQTACRQYLFISLFEINL